LRSTYSLPRLLDPPQTSITESRKSWVIIPQVVSGVDFLGAGPIALRKDAVQGLTTAASIWLAESLRLACGAGMYPTSGTTVLAL